MIGEIAGLIAALAFFALVVLLAFPLLKLSKALDKTSQSIEELSAELEKTLAESTKLVESTNTQLEKVDSVTTSAAEISQNASAVVALYSSVLGMPIIKVVSALSAVKNASRAGFQKLKIRRGLAEEPASSFPNPTDLDNSGTL